MARDLNQPHESSSRACVATGRAAGSRLVGDDAARREVDGGGEAIPSGPRRARGARRRARWMAPERAALEADAADRPARDGGTISGAMASFTKPTPKEEAAVEEVAALRVIVAAASAAPGFGSELTTTSLAHPP